MIAVMFEVEFDPQVPDKKERYFALAAGLKSELEKVDGNKADKANSNTIAIFYKIRFY